MERTEQRNSGGVNGGGTRARCGEGLMDAMGDCTSIRMTAAFNDRAF